MVGATGGSGTRVVARILRDAGLYIGTVLNESEDAVRFGHFSDRWINAYLSRREEAPGDGEREMVVDLNAVLRDHCRDLEAQPQPWGWKEPRSIYLLQFLHRHVARLRFLHVVRDGRDMALSVNQNQLRKHGDAAPIPAGLPPATRSMALWSWINLEAARYGEERLGDRYLRVRFEDLCARPVELTQRILDFCGLDGEAALAGDEVVPPTSLGRWQEEDPATIAELERVGGPALLELGYEAGIATADSGESAR